MQVYKGQIPCLHIQPPAAPIMSVRAGASTHQPAGQHWGETKNLGIGIPKISYLSIHFVFFFGNLFGHVNLHFTFSLVSFKNDLL